MGMNIEMTAGTINWPHVVDHKTYSGFLNEFMDEVRRLLPKYKGLEEELNSAGFYVCQNCGKWISSDWRYVEEVRCDPQQFCCDAKCAAAYFGDDGWEESLDKEGE